MMINIVIPVFNEEEVLSNSIHTLSKYCENNLRGEYIITIGDNASTDRTLQIAYELELLLPNVKVEHLEEKGRGRMLKHAWSTIDADIHCYMDVDLATGLEALLPLKAALESGHSQLAIGTRLNNYSRVVRLEKRDFISRSYNKILKNSLHAKFTDAQCGFKGITRDAFNLIQNDVNDPNWFFDTELLYVAQMRGLRIFEIPVDWVDDPDSRVNITETIAQDLRGIYYLRSRAKFFASDSGMMLLPPMPAQHRISHIQELNGTSRIKKNEAIPGRVMPS